MSKARASRTAPAVSDAAIRWASSASLWSAPPASAAAKTATSTARPNEPPIWWATLVTPPAAPGVLGRDVGQTAGGQRPERAALTDPDEDHR
jgi:hypothetical protein